MNVKVAVASSDGIVVNAHFGRTPQFLIYNMDEKGDQLLETRKNIPGCSSLKETKGTMDETIESISDCHYLIVGQIGKPMIQRLAETGIEVWVIRDMIEEALGLLRSKIL